MMLEKYTEPPCKQLTKMSSFSGYLHEKVVAYKRLDHIRSNFASLA